MSKTICVLFVDHVETTLPDGSVVKAYPNDTPEDVARAHELGYNGDVLAMTLNHDPLHVWLAQALGLYESPALRDAAEGTTSTLGEAEECVVLALQRYLNLLRRPVPRVTQ